jgi:hypothetical protein
MTIRSKLCALGILAAAGLFIGAAEARDCIVVGTAPFCGTRPTCPANYERLAVMSSKCLTGHQAYCCEKQGFISQSQTRGSTAAGQVKQPKGSDILKEKTTAAEEVKQRRGTGSLKLPNSSKASKVQQPSDPLAKARLKTIPNPCGPGWHKGGDGQCHIN